MAKYSELKQWLIANKITYKDIAKLLNLSVSTLSRKLNVNNVDFTIQEIRTLVKAYNLDFDEFFLNP